MTVRYEEHVAAGEGRLEVSATPGERVRLRVEGKDAILDFTLSVDAAEWMARTTLEVCEAIQARRMPCREE